MNVTIALSYTEAYLIQEIYLKKKDMSKSFQEKMKNKLSSLFQNTTLYLIEFSNLEILNSIWWIKPFTFCFYKTKYG